MLCPWPTGNSENGTGFGESLLTIHSLLLLLLSLQIFGDLDSNIIYNCDDSLRIDKDKLLSKGFAFGSFICKGELVTKSTAVENVR